MVSGIWDNPPFQDNFIIERLHVYEKKMPLPPLKQIGIIFLVVGVIFQHFSEKLACPG